VVLTIYSNVLLGKKTLPTGDHPSPGGQRLTAGAPSGCGSHPLSLAATLTLAPTDSLAGMSRRDCPPPSDPPGGPTLAQSRGHPFCPLIQYWPFMPHGGFTGSDDEEDLNWLPLCSSPKGKGVQIWRLNGRCVAVAPQGPSHLAGRSTACYRHNLAGPEGGPRSKMGSKHNRSGLANRPLRGRLRPGLAMYLDRCVHLK
jgi:hypothetical protein